MPIAGKGRLRHKTGILLLPGETDCFSKDQGFTRPPVLPPLNLRTNLNANAGLTSASISNTLPLHFTIPTNAKINHYLTDYHYLHGTGWNYLYSDLLDAECR